MVENEEADLDVTRGTSSLTSPPSAPRPPNAFLSRDRDTARAASRLAACMLSPSKGVGDDGVRPHPGEAAAPPTSPERRVPSFSQEIGGLAIGGGTGRPSVGGPLEAGRRGVCEAGGGALAFPSHDIPPAPFGSFRAPKQGGLAHGVARDDSLLASPPSPGVDGVLASPSVPGTRSVLASPSAAPNLPFSTSSPARGALSSLAGLPTLTAGAISEEQLRQDDSHTRELEEEAGRLVRRRAQLEARLRAAAGGLDASAEAGAAVKRLLLALRVRREDFANLHAAGNGGDRAGALSRVGARILSALEEDDDVGVAGSAGEGGDGGAGPDHIHGGRGIGPAGHAVGRSAAVTDPSTSGARKGTLAGAVGDAARRQDGDAGGREATPARAGDGGGSRHLPLPSPLLPPSPCDRPEEAQIAAAALVAHGGDPAAALAALMAVAMAAWQSQPAQRWQQRAEAA